jgi:hypothetical protein
MRTAVAASRGWLTEVDGFRGTVMALHPCSVYVAPDSGGDLLVVHDLSHPHSPTSILVDVSMLNGWPASIGDVAAGRAGYLRVGDLVLDVRQARTWSQAPPPSHARALAPPVIERLAAQADQRIVTDTAAAVRAGALRSLVGRGPGLTPAGDDAIVGILAVLHRLGPHNAVAPLVAALTPLLDRTTAISAHFLRLAMRGAFTEALVDVVDAVATTDGPTDVQIRRLLATGATSGADALAGVVAALTIATDQPFVLEEVA